VASNLEDWSDCERRYCAGIAVDVSDSDGYVSDTFHRGGMLDSGEGARVERGLELGSVVM
jgi:hypothetical protein